MDLVFQQSDWWPERRGMPLADLVEHRNHPLVRLASRHGVDPALMADVLDGLVDAEQAARWIHNPPFARSPRPH